MKRLNRVAPMAVRPLILVVGLSVTATTGAVAETSKDVVVVNTPGVNVVNSPTVHVGNPAQDPVLVRDVDRAARTPFQETCTGITSCSVDIPGSGVLVIEYLTMEVVIEDPSVPLQTFVQTKLNGVSKSHAFRLVRNGATAADFGVYVASQQVRLYADAFSTGSSVSASVINSSGVSPTSFFLSIAGYRVDCSPGPACPLP